MRTWTKCACAVLIWAVLAAILAVAALTGCAGPARASMHSASSTSNTKTVRSRPAAAPVTAPSPAIRPAASRARYIVQPGDTLSGIAARLTLPGGWPALYAANRAAIGPSPGRIHPGTVLRLPGVRAPARYRVTAGDTLSAIAARFAVHGGWPALYAANRPAIGASPDVIRPGTVLTVPPPPGPARPGPGLAQRPAPVLAPPPPAATPHHSQPTTRGPAAATGMPRWLKIILAAAGLLILAVLATEPLLTAGRRRLAVPLPATEPPATEPPATAPQSGTPPPAGPAVPGPRRGAPATAGIVLADHPRLVVTRHPHDGTVYVLRPPGEDPRAILRVARLVLPEGPYGELARRLGVPATGPAD